MPLVCVGYALMCFLVLNMQMDNGTNIQKKTYALALAVILTLRLTEVMDKLDDILRYNLLKECTCVFCVCLNLLIFLFFYYY